MGFTPCKAKHPVQDIELQEKKTTIELKYTGNLFRKNLQLKDIVHSRLKANTVIGIRTAFYL